MVSIREVRRMIKEETERGVTKEAADELQVRINMLARGLIRVADYEANKKSDRARMTTDHVRLAYLTYIDTKETEITTDEEDEEEWGEWNEESD